LKGGSEVDCNFLGVVGNIDDDVDGVVACKVATDGLVFSGRSFPLKGSLMTAGAVVTSLETSLVSSCASTIFLTPFGAFMAAFLLDIILLLIMRVVVVVVEVSTRIVVLITWVAKLNPETQVCLAITDI
jgi:hypothetical protein